MTIRQTLYRNDNFTNKAGAGLPIYSKSLDSVRAYQFECNFKDVPLVDGSIQRDFTLAAKTVSPITMQVQDIEVRRINDKFYYPGNVETESVTVTFDNLINTPTTKGLWLWFKTIYDPITGNITTQAPPGAANPTQFKCNRLQIVELDNYRNPKAVIELYGVYPKSVKFAEKNYNTNEFSTVEVEFKFDLMDYKISSDGLSIV